MPTCWPSSINSRSISQSIVSSHSSIMIILCCSVLQLVFFDYFHFLNSQFSFLDYDHFVLQCVAVGILRFFFFLKSQFPFLNYDHFVLQCLAVGTPQLFSQDSVLIPRLFSFRVAVSYSWYSSIIS